MLYGENLNSLPTCLILPTRFSPHHWSCPALKSPSEQPWFGFYDEVLFYRKKAANFVYGKLISISS